MTLLFRLADQSPMNCSQYSELHRVDAVSLLYVDPFQDCDEVHLAEDYVLRVLSTLPGIVRDHRYRCSPDIALHGRFCIAGFEKREHVSQARVVTNAPISQI